MTDNLSVFPLPLVLLPGELLPLRIFEARYLDMVANCLRNEEPFVLSPVLNPELNQEHLNPVGTTAKIIEWNKRDDRTLHIIVQGTKKVEIENPRIENNGLIVARATETIDSDSHPSFEALRFMTENNKLKDTYKQSITSIDKNSAISAAYEIANLIELTLSQRFSILIESSGAGKLELIGKFLTNYVNPDIPKTLH
ncbi:MAG: LON peptidase substrate-binding domain-containing protein [Pseudomonadota bacterium]|nr:LON peptidase substrate-binding domain-containing protein [Pseudomonadota bacterium]